MRVIILFAIFLCFISIELSGQPVKIAYEKDFVPYSYINENGDADGVLIDLYKLWAEKSGNEVVFLPCKGEACLNDVLRGNVDLLAGTIEIKEHQRITYSPPIIRLSTSLFLKKDLELKDLDDFNDSIAFLKGSKLTNLSLGKYPGLKLRAIETYEEFERLVGEQIVTAFIFTMPDPADESLRMKIPNGYMRYQHLSTTEFRPTVLTENTDLLKSIITSMDIITPKEVVEISKTHNLYMTEEVDYRFIYFSILGGLLTLVVVLLGRNAYLKKFKSIISLEENDWLKVIKQGENDQVEFKSSLRWDYRQESINKELDKVILKTISAFLNADGGILFIGVNDEGEILGLQNDYESFKKQNSDGFLITITSLINQQLGKDIHRLLKINIIEIDGRDVCIVNMLKSEKPVFLGNKGKEEFFVRASASSQPLGMSEALSYIKEHWPAK